ncbi:MAG: sugar transferase [Phycisphaerales bacterium]|nr:sugar transferase [Phycisphaerales bacterium]MCB9835356.1 sugar transferase [Phycisphaera sp.]
MSTLLRQDPPALKSVCPDAATPVWGLTLTEIHDRYWASRGFQIVRPKGPRPDPNGPELYILLDEDKLVGFGVRRLLRIMSWMHPRAIRVRLVETESTPYRESVRDDEDGRFLKFVRSYNARQIHSAQLWITPSIDFANAWNQSLSGKQASRMLSREIPTEQRVALRVPGRIFKTDAEGSDDFRRWILRSWASPSGVIQGVYQPSPGVWIHETCTIDPNARIIGPVWLGAGHDLKSGETVVGPAIIPDSPTAKAQPSEIDWYAVTHSAWRLIPTLRKRPLRAVSKRAFDIVVALTAILVTLPIYPIIMAAIYLDDGRPFFFKHYRQQFGGRSFPCLKFRSMRRDAEEIKKQLQAQNKSDGPQFHMDNDPRLLRIGKFIRKYKIDELPQFFNVLVGHMSIVGPRPSPDNENQYCPAWREARLSVRPGITGLWQVKSQRMPMTDFQEWIRFDLEYVQNNSWRLDIWIMVETVKKIVFRS